MRRQLVRATLAILIGTEAAMAFSLSSSAFEQGAAIPRRHTCDAGDESPPLAWHDSPSGTKAFALVVDDPDAPAGTWVHWVLYDLPGSTQELPAHVSGAETLPGGGRQGVNDFRRTGYGGPCPPPGKPHRYAFHLYALDAPAGLPARATKAQLLAAIQGHVLGTAELTGTYQRQGG
jgi:Raf kinase inhibitor-like YbhB/YbcL family protein